MSDASAPMSSIAPDLIVRDPQAALDELRQRWTSANKHGAERWVFGYASLIWRPEFDAAEQRSALVHGWHRSLRMRSRVNRGTPQQPGLVFALLPGGACRGVVYRLKADNGEAELDRLWAREMPTGVYDARLLPCKTATGTVLALAFTLSRRSDAFLNQVPDTEMLHILRHAKGRYGSTLDYLVETAHALRQRGVHDREIERLMLLARRHGLVAASAAFKEPAAPAS
jgi:glutathione-specific gamma-glutamylcyclotransferase